MALPASGLITMEMIAAEFGGSPPYLLSQYYRGGGRVTANNTNVPTSGPISLSQFYGARKSVPGSTNYSAGSHSVTIPIYSTITMEIWGAGGGGGGNSSGTAYANTWFGGTGGQSYFTAPSGTIYANGGTGGGNCTGGRVGANGANGSPDNGYYGDVNVLGGGNAGGPPQSWAPYVAGTGGYGGYVKKTWAAGAAGAPVPGVAYTLGLGFGGAAGAGDWAYGFAGSGATARVSWT